MEHLTIDDLISYFVEDLDDTNEERAELHIADCDRCATTARRIHDLGRDVGAALDGWTAASHAAAETSFTGGDRD